MRHMGGCTECFTVWWGCRCPLRCEECGAGYRDDGNSTCGTPGCRAGQRRHWEMLDRWEALRQEPAADIQCEAVEPVPAEPEREERNVTPLATEAEMGSPSVTPSEPDHGEAEGVSITEIPSPSSRPSARRRPAAEAHTNWRTPQPSKPAHRPVAERRAAVEALLAEGLSDREIARRAGVSPSTVSAVRKAQGAAKIGA
jgi:hypothetical protein